MQGCTHNVCGDWTGMCEAHSEMYSDLFRDEHWRGEDEE
jgi:hypothetical protein